MHNSFWGMDDGGYSPCSVAGYIGGFSFESGPYSKHTYVVLHEGFHYAARHRAVADALVSAAVKRRIGRSKQPHLIGAARRKRKSGKV